MTVPTPFAALRARASIRPALVLALLVFFAVACGDEPADDSEVQEPDAADEQPEEPDAPVDDDVEASARTNPTSCVDDPAPGVDHFPEQVRFEHSEVVDASYHETYKVLEIALPFDDEPARFVLVQCGVEPPALEGDLAGASVIEVPVTEAVTMTTTNLPHFDALGAVDRLVGVGDPDFVTTDAVRDAIGAGDITGFGDAEGSPDIERVIAASPDVLTVDAFGEAVLDTATRLEEAGVPVLLNADFLETTLLGRAEWLKVTAMLLNAEAEADQAFGEIADAYDEIADTVADVDDRPVVLSDMPFEGTWFAAGGRSVTANAIAAAGGEYVFSDDDSAESVAYDMETVIDRASDADVWIAAGSVHGTIDDLVATDERFAAIQAVQDGEVWAGDAATTPEGGNARFEEAYLRADLFLADLAAIMHPDLVDHDPRYYGRIPEG